MEGDIEDNMECGKCGLCRTICSVFDTDAIETLSPRGKIKISKSGIASERAAEALLLCAMCKRCDEICPSGVDVTKTIIAGRRNIIKFMPEKINEISDIIEKTGNILGRKASSDKEIKSSGKIQYYAGCMGKYRTEDYRDTIKILNKLGINYYVNEETCCGEIFELLGMDDEMEKFRDKNKFNDDVIVSCPGCYNALIPAVNVKHFTEFLDDFLDKNNDKNKNFKIIYKSDKPVRVAYHDPCDLGRRLKIYDAPRNVLESIEGVTLVEFENNRENAKCCGAGGSVMFLNTKTSMTIAQNRVKGIEEHADLIVTACPTCKVNLRLACKRLRNGVEVKTVSEFLEECEIQNS